MVFWQLTVPISEETSEGLTNHLWEQGALGVLEEEAPGTPSRLRAFYPDTTSPASLLDSVNRYLAGLLALGFPSPTGGPEVSPLRDEAWASAWTQSFRPREIGERLLVVPPWETGWRASAGRAPRIPVIIEPGRAFGTGHHGSTEGCLVLLDAATASLSVERVLDIGTGSGILAIAAIKLGVAGALAIDVDPDAIAATEANAARNGCGHRIQAVLGEAESLPDEAASPLVVANLLTHTHLAFSDDYARLVTARGSLILGGILAEEDRALTGSLESSGFSMRSRVVIDGWSSLLFSRTGRGLAPLRGG